MIKRSQVVLKVCDLASQGRYDGVTPQGARNMNTTFELAAALINELEAEEVSQDNEQLMLEAQAEQLAEDEDDRFVDEGGQ